MDLSMESGSRSVRSSNPPQLPPCQPAPTQAVKPGGRPVKLRGKCFILPSRQLSLHVTSISTAMATSGFIGITLIRSSDHSG